MSDHIIVVSAALGEPYVPPLIDEEYDNSFWVQWTRPESQDTVKTDSAFIVKFNRPIDLTLLTLDNFEIQRITAESPLETEAIATPFLAFDTEEDYDSLSRELVLRLSEDLPALAEFFFVVTNLQDTTGAVQTENHVVLFSTSGTGVEYDADTEFDIDQVVIEDHTLVSPPYPSGGGTSAVSTVTCSIADGTLNVASSVSTITLTYLEAITTGDITVNEENLETGATQNLVITVSQNGTTFVATITLPNQGTEAAPLYVMPNCIYTIDAIYTTFQFAGVIDPFYVPLNNFLPYTTSAVADPIGWARLVYMISCEVKARIGDNVSDYLLNEPDSVKNFTKYLILSLFTGVGTNDSFMLGELQITSGVKSNVDYKSMLDQWEAKLFGYGCRNTRVVDVVGPRAPSYHKHSEHVQRIMERAYGTFDRRMF
jgi:hypothetical protein